MKIKKLKIRNFKGIKKLEIKFNDKITTILNNLEIRKLESNISDVMHEIYNLEKYMREAREDIDNYIKKREVFLKKYKEVQNMLMSEDDKRCFNCGKNYDESEINDILQKFDSKKTTSLQEINNEAVANNIKMTTANRFLEQCEADLVVAKAKKLQFEAKLKDLQE